nr:hypothetical protein BaRGS_026055 [Batillaria attramentaria]
MLNITKLDDDMFGKLEEQYRENAVIGAIAAAVMLVLVGGACIIWHFRYSKRNSARGDGSSIEDDPKADMKYRNQAFDGGDMIETAPAAPDDKPNGTTTTTTDGTENGGYESFRM